MFETLFPWLTPSAQGQQWPQQKPVSNDHIIQMLMELLRQQQQGDSSGGGSKEITRRTVEDSAQNASDSAIPGGY